MPLFSRMRSRRSLKGFTLVELLIVVAIIGVLSTVGVPTFRKMVQKAKKTEAKVNLGGLYTTEMAFFSEYGGYGNNLAGIGFEVDGNVSIYRIGFYDTSMKAPAVLPTKTSGIGKNIDLAYAGYYVAGDFVANQGNTGVAASPREFKVADDAGSAFNAGAVGPIAPGVAADAATKMDGWEINERRQLTNFQDGVGKSGTSSGSSSGSSSGTSSGH